MADKLMQSPMKIHKIAPSVDYNQWPKLNEPTNQNSIKVLKVVTPTNKKHFNETLGTSLITSPMSPPSLVKRVKKETIQTVKFELKRSFFIFLIIHVMQQNLSFFVIKSMFTVFMF